MLNEIWSKLSLGVRRFIDRLTQMNLSSLIKEESPMKIRPKKVHKLNPNSNWGFTYCKKEVRFDRKNNFMLVTFFWKETTCKNCLKFKPKNSIYND